MSNSKRAKARIAAARSVRAKYRHKRYPDNREPSTCGTLPAGSFEQCWCGQASFHDWPGKDDGAPHPR